jgi:hypothetical protein
MTEQVFQNTDTLTFNQAGEALNASLKEFDPICIMYSFPPSMHGPGNYLARKTGEYS